MSSLFAFRTETAVNYGNNKNKPDTPYIGNGSLRRMKVEESNWHKVITESEELVKVTAKLASEKRKHEIRNKSVKQSK